MQTKILYSEVNLPLHICYQLLQYPVLCNLRLISKVDMVQNPVYDIRNILTSIRGTIQHRNTNNFFNSQCAFHFFGVTRFSGCKFNDNPLTRSETSLSATYMWLSRKPNGVLLCYDFWTRGSTQLLSLSHSSPLFQQPMLLFPVPVSGFKYKL